MTQFGNESEHEWLDPLTCDPIKAWLQETAAEIDCPEDCPEPINDDLVGLTIIKPHITASGTIVGLRVLD